MVDLATCRSALITVGRLAAARGLVWGTSGNISARLDATTFLITASGTMLDQLRTSSFVICDLDGEPGEPPRASSEIQLHRRIYQRRPDVQAVLHLSPFWATLAACLDLPLPTDVTPESMLYLGHVVRVPYIQPGTDTLGLTTAELLGEAGSAALLENHGAVTVGATPADALRRMETLEFLCRLVLTARTMQLPLRRVGEEAAESLRRSAYRRAHQGGR